MTSAEILARLEEAGRLLTSMPSIAARRLKAPPMEVMHAIADCELPSKMEPISAAQIARMNEAFGWISLIPRDRYVLRRIVGARCLISPATGKHVYSWRRLAALLGADVKAIQRWHAQGIALIVAACDGGAPPPPEPGS